MTAVAEQDVLEITEPGIYDGIPEDVYHADPVRGGSLSVSGAKKLLAPSCPAKFKWERDHPSPSTKAMELGTAAHKLVLGTGAELVVVDAKDWRTDKAKNEAKGARLAGKVPLLTKDHEIVLAMAAAIREHPLASAIFDPARGGHAEQSFFWFDEQWGVWRRGRLDWLPAQPYLVDYKTCVSAELSAVVKAIINFRYFQQDAWYSDGIAAITGQMLPFLFVMQEKEPPYLVTVVQLKDQAIDAGRILNNRALEKFRDCTESGVWPGYSEGIEMVELPAWAMPREDW